MTWYKDRDFPEVKASNADIIAVIENTEQLKRVIKEYNDLEDKWLECRKELRTHESLLKEICDEWNEDCEPNCSSWGHEKECKSINIAKAKKALKDQLIESQAYASGLRNFLLSIAQYLPGETGKRNPLYELHEILAKPMNEWSK